MSKNIKLESYMTDTAILHEKLDNLNQKVSSQSNDLADIKKALITMSEQRIRIDTLYEDIAELKQAKNCGSAEISKIKEFQAGCPQKEIRRTFSWMWGFIAFNSTIILCIVGALLKHLG